MKITKDVLKQLIKEELAAKYLAEARGAPSWKAAIKARPEKDAARAEEEAREFDRERFEQGAQPGERVDYIHHGTDAPELDPGSASQPTVPRVPTITADEVRVKINTLYKAGKISRPVMLKARRALYSGDRRPTQGSELEAEVSFHPDDFGFPNYPDYGPVTGNYTPDAGIEAALEILAQGGQRMRQPARQEPGRARQNESKQRLTKEALKQIIKEEYDAAIKEKG